MKISIGCSVHFQRLVKIRDIKDKNLFIILLIDSVTEHVTGVTLLWVYRQFGPYQASEGKDQLTIALCRPRFTFSTKILRMNLNKLKDLKS